MSSKVRRVVGLMVGISVLGVGCGQEVQPVWSSATPQSQGLVATKLDAIWSNLRERETTSFLVIRNDRIVYERYASGSSRTTPHYTASLAKSLIGGMSLMLAMDDGRAQPDDLASLFIPQWSGIPGKGEITLRHLVTHTSGIEDAEEDNLAHDQLTGWKGDFWKREPEPLDPFSISRDLAPVLDPPGTKLRYSNPGMAILAYCLTASLRGAAQPDLRSFLKERIMIPIGVPEGEWSVGYGRTTMVDGLPLVATWGGGSFSPNASARLGRLLLYKGTWEGEEVLSRATVAMATQYAGMPAHSGLGWWVNRNPDGTPFWPSVPDDAFWGLGAGGQFLLVIPSLNLIVVRNGGNMSANDDTEAQVGTYIMEPLMDAFAHRIEAPYPASPVIRRIDWDGRESIVRLAQGSDNWPMTWADDDALYTAYGDGHGFEPFVPEKLSLGFARVVGSPSEFTFENIRSSTGEQQGDGSSGRKASGLLMMEGTLFMWVRNAGNSQLSWSIDHATTWKWSSWKFTESFGFPSFLNFGRDYSGSRDEFIYVYSPDADSAYERADRLVLARVDKERVRDREAYEFFVRVDSDGEVLWSREISDRGVVFSDPGACFRPHVTYYPALKRYLLTMSGPGVDNRFVGGIGVYDAAEPWGPWTTAFYTDTWDVGPGESSEFPAKWFGANDGTARLVFSGDDSFSIRRATIVPWSELRDGQEGGETQEGVQQ